MENINKYFVVKAFTRISIIFFLFGYNNIFAAWPATVNLLWTDSFAILSKTQITNVPTSVITGNVWASPITGASIHLTCPEVTWTIYSVDATWPLPCRITDPALLTTAVSNMESAYLDAASRPTPTATELWTWNIGWLIITPWLYKWSTDVNIPTDVTLSGSASDVWIFQIAWDLTIASAKKIILVWWARAANIFWQVWGPTWATLWTTSIFNWTILSAKQIIIQTNATLNWRALAQTQVTLDQANVNIPSSIPIPATLNIIKQVINSGTWSAIPSVFNIYVKLAGVNIAWSPGSWAVSPWTTYSINPGSYIVSEDSNIYYLRTFSGDCDSNGNITLLSGDNKTCTVINTYIPIPSSPSSWWGGGSWLTIDYCPNWDNSYSYYDWLCEDNSNITSTWTYNSTTIPSGSWWTNTDNIITNETEDIIKKIPTIPENELINNKINTPSNIDSKNKITKLPIPIPGFPDSGISPEKNINYLNISILLTFLILFISSIIFLSKKHLV